MDLLSQKVWLITGSSTGFGKAIAAEALAQGARVAATARALDALADLRAAYPETCLPLAFDVTDLAQAGEVVRATVERFGRLDVVVNNAGYGLIGSLEETDDGAMRRSFETIVFGAVRVIQAALPTLRAQRSGRIINISAAAAISNYAGFSIYGGAKFALEGISEALAAEVKPLGIQVTLVQPGPFRTDFISRSLERVPSALPDYAGTAGKFAAFLDKIDGQQPGDPVKAAQAIVKLAAMENPPARLPLGKYAVDKIERLLAARRRELDAVKDLALTADF